MNTNIQLQSNSIRGDFKDEIVDKTMTEIHDTIKTVFGPYGTDAFIVKDSVSTNKTYYTRDGKEVLKSLEFSNPLASYVKSILYQAVERQGSMIGDGTTTLAVFYTNLYEVLRKTEFLKSHSLTEIRRTWNAMTQSINERLKKISSTDISKDEFASMIYTCTQDAELTKLFVETIVDKIEAGAYVTVNRADQNDDISVEVNGKPLIKAELLTTLYPLESNEFDAITLFVNGALDIAHMETMQYLCECHIGGCKNIVIICSNTTPATRNTLKQYIKWAGSVAKSRNVSLSDICSNLIIMKIPDFNIYPSEMVEDLATYIYGTENINGIISSITFEALIYQSYTKMLEENGNTIIPVEDLSTFEFDPKHITMVRKCLTDYPVKYSELDGLQLNIPMNPISEKRYQTLRQQLENEKSAIKKKDLTKRLKSLYGQFVEVNIGSKLLKDGQRKYELMLDAVLSAVNAKTYGALKTNSICAAYCATLDELNKKIDNLPVDETIDAVTFEPSFSDSCAKVMVEAFEKTIYDMYSNAFPVQSYDDFIKYLFNIGELNAMNPNDPLRRKYNHTLNGVSYAEDFNFKFNLNRGDPYKVFDPDINDPAITVGDFSISDTIVEPLPIITSILENSVMMVELAFAKMFNIGSFIGNYL